MKTENAVLQDALRPLVDKEAQHWMGRRHIQRPFVGLRHHRGKRRFVVGYTWSRPGSHFMKGLVYEHIMGFGESFEEAFAKANAKGVK